MKLIVITTPQLWDGEAEAINRLFAAGLEILHLRKPAHTTQEVARLLEEINPACHARIVVHDHFELAQTYPLLGLHLNSRHPQPPQGYSGQLSCSCHSLHELSLHRHQCSYMFLSPIYDSISKEGYGAAFTPESLRIATEQGIINHQVIALGGINQERLHDIRQYGFGGAALLGDIWQRPVPEQGKYFKTLLKQLCK